MKEYDLVELIQDRDHYKKKGVHKGMFWSGYVRKKRERKVAGRFF